MLALPQVDLRFIPCIPCPCRFYLFHGFMPCPPPMQLKYYGPPKTGTGYADGMGLVATPFGPHPLVLPPQSRPPPFASLRTLFWAPAAPSGGKWACGPLPPDCVVYSLGSLNDFR